MIPLPNVVAGALIGAANDAWVGVLIASAVWPFTFCVYVSFVDSPRLEDMTDKLGSRVKVYLVEFWTAASTALPVATIVYLVRSVFT